ncbi:hypothetical protein PC128_g19800 [Phytophthora cactorum]|nr:hypothetical protein PC128_g19800 [Phytophthora cactorum]
MVVQKLGPYCVVVQRSVPVWESDGEGGAIQRAAKHKAGRGSRKAEQIRVIEAFRHSLYYAKFLLYDVAILKLERPSVHQPARLCAADGSANKPGTVATVLGWGLVNNGTFGGTLQTVDVQIIPDVKCHNYTIDSNIVMCADTEHGKDACNGGSGGPLIANGALVGIVSGAPGECGDMPGLYARVARVHDYIKDILSGGSSVNVTEMLTQGGRFSNGIERRPVARSKICTQ